jgi:uncharacterized protein (DUF849 family)
VAVTRGGLLKAALNGPQGPGTHPALPVTPTAVAADAAQAQRAGAGAVHIHPKTPDGLDSLAPEWVAAHVEKVRECAPGLPVGVTTGAWIESDPRRRVAQIREWAVLPDFASVNWHEDGAQSVATALLERGVAVEAGLFHEDAAAVWASSGALSTACLRAMIELPDRRWSSTRRQLHRMLGLLEQRETPVLVHGEGASCWGALRFAATHGYDMRIGLEDTTQLPSGVFAADNRELVLAATAIAAETSSEPR